MTTEESLGNDAVASQASQDWSFGHCALVIATDVGECNKMQALIHGHSYPEANEYPVYSN